MNVVELCARAAYCAQEGMEGAALDGAHVKYWFDENQCSADGYECIKQEYERIVRAVIDTLAANLTPEIVRTAERAAWDRNNHMPQPRYAEVILSAGLAAAKEQGL